MYYISVFFFDFSSGEKKIEITWGKMFLIVKENPENWKFVGKNFSKNGRKKNSVIYIIYKIYITTKIEKIAYQQLFHTTSNKLVRPLANGNCLVF